LHCTSQVKSQLAEGGYGYVYRAEDELTRKEYALKMMRIPRERGGGLVDDEAADMAKAEQSTLKRLSSHPNIVETIDCGVVWEETEVRYYILSEFCPRSVLGLLLDARRSSHGGHLPERDIMWVLRDTLMALLHLHSQSPPVAHRDLKPENLLIGEDGRCKLCDFGSASTRHRAFVGEREITAAKEEIRRHTTPAYRAPEQVRSCCWRVCAAVLRSAVL
jgi:AP2-associated kinase